MKIIPAIDIIHGQCVRLTQGNYEAKKVYDTHPLEIAKEYEANGIEHLHIVDLDGAKAGHLVNWKVLEKICTQTSLHVDFGGGLQSDEDLKIAFRSGAKQITGGSIAVKNPDLFASWIQEFGGDKIILGADVKEEKIAISGWQKITDIDLYIFLEEYIQKGIQTIICTDIQKDGLLQGTSNELYQKIMGKFPRLQVIASGGVAGVEDLDSLAMMEVHGVIIGKALYEKRITLKQLKKYLP